MKKLSTNLFLVFGIVLIGLAGQNLFAQGSNVEKQVYKTTKTTPKKATPKSTPVKKATPKKTTPKRVVPKKTTTRNTRSTRKRSRNNILVTFNTPEPQLEIWRGEERLGITDETSKLETWLPKGNFLVSVKNQDGDAILGKQMITVSKKNKEFSLEYDKPTEDEEKEEKPTAEELLKDQERASAADAAEKINDILKRYGDPLKTNTVSLSDWEFVYQNAQANTAKNFTAIQIEAQRWFSSGQIDLAKGNYANASTSFRESIKYMPDSAYPYYGLGESYTANKEYVAATKSYQLAISVDPKFALAHRKLGTIYLNSKQTKESAISFENAIKNGFDTPDVRFDLAKSYLENKDWEKASIELEAVVKIAPTADVHLKLGELYTNLKRNISAYESYKRATELSPTSAIAFFKLGEIFFEEKEYERAKLAFEKSLELDEKGKEININQAKKLVRESAQKLK